ncbi:MAG: mechanosensitive ion channel domain-containing protein, partial [Bdellovibrionales bacterium]
TIRSWNFNNNETRRKWVATVNNASLLLLLFALFFIWGNELRSLAISLVAIAAALVLATKELILCLMGGILKASSKLFELGDRISIKDIRGEVVDHNFLVTTLFEIGPGELSNQFTGRRIKIPNSIFLNSSIAVAPAGNHYSLHVFTLVLQLNKNLRKTEALLLEAANEASKDYIQEADEYIRNICKKEGVDTPYLKPRVFFYTKDKETAEFHIRMPVPFNLLSRTEKKFKSIFFDKYFGENHNE